MCPRACTTTAGVHRHVSVYTYVRTAREHNFYLSFESVCIRNALHYCASGPFHLQRLRVGKVGIPHVKRCALWRCVVSCTCVYIRNGLCVRCMYTFCARVFQKFGCDKWCPGTSTLLNLNNLAVNFVGKKWEASEYCKGGHAMLRHVMQEKREHAAVPPSFVPSFVRSFVRSFVA